MKTLTNTLLRWAKRIVMATMLAYMIAWHNVYKEDTKTPNNIEIVSQMEDKEQKPTGHM